MASVIFLEPNDGKTLVEEAEAIEISVDEARSILDGDEPPEDFFDALDKSQGDVFSGQKSEGWIVIHIVKD